MDISEAALTEFIQLYKKEFEEGIAREDALIIARNLVLFYQEITKRGVMNLHRDLIERPNSEDGNL